ncbi:MAG: efflux RND transporter periplasmic adaptor subunit [Candidatus Gastranaerophilaceae bacterium]
MNKKSLIVILLIVAILILTAIAVKKNRTMLIQGEVDTKTVDLSSKITGRVKAIHVKKGEMIEAGQLLITLDTPDISAKVSQSDAALDLALAQEEKVNNGARSEQRNMALSSLRQAQAGMELAQKTYNRMNKLHAEGVIATQKLDEATAQYKSASRSVDAAKSNYQMLMRGERVEDKMSAVANVNRAKGAVSEVNSYLSENQIKSPISGQITDISVEEGELVGAGYPIITVVSVDDNWVVFNLREDLIAKIRIGSEFDVKIPAIGKKPVRVRVNYISALGNFATWRATRIRGDFDMKTFEVRAVPIEKTDGLRAGMTAVVDWNRVK